MLAIDNWVENFNNFSNWTHDKILYLCSNPVRIFFDHPLNFNGKVRIVYVPLVVLAASRHWPIYFNKSIFMIMGLLLIKPLFPAHKYTALPNFLKTLHIEFLIQSWTTKLLRRNYFQANSFIWFFYSKYDLILRFQKKFELFLNFTKFQKNVELGKKKLTSLVTIIWLQ